MTAPLTQAAEDAQRFAHRRETWLRQVENAARAEAQAAEDKAIAAWAAEIADATFRLKRSLHTEGDQQRADRTWAALQIERAGLDVCRALGEA